MPRNTKQIEKRPISRLLEYTRRLKADPIAYKKKISEQNKRKRLKMKTITSIENPIKYKAFRLRSCLTTHKTRNALSMLQIYDKICIPMNCPYCEKIMAIEEISVDHIIPISRNGLRDMSNIQFVCKRCNFLKANWTDLEYRKFMLIAKQHPELYILLEIRRSFVPVDSNMKSDYMKQRCKNNNIPALKCS